MKTQGTLAAFSLIVLSACSSSPSDSDAKKAVESALGGCRFLSLENFQKVNGIANNDGSHTMEIKYSIKAKVFPEVAKMAADYSARWSATVPRLEKAREADAAAQKELYERNEKLRRGIKDMGEWHAFKAETEKFDKEVALPANQLVSAINKERDELKREESAIAQRFKQECPSMNERLQYLMYDNNMGLDNYTKDFTKDYHVKLQMVKTDNGWMPAN
jgi:hypothetical protein